MATANPTTDEEDIEDILRNAPIRCLNISTRAKLSEFLNPPRSIPSRCGIVADWRGVAELRDFQYQQIQNFQLSSDPMGRLLDEYENSENHEDNSVQSLLSILQDLDRYDVLEEIRPHIERDIQKYKRGRQRVQVPTVTSNQPDHIPWQDDFLVPEDRFIVVDDSEDNVTIFDAFVCYTKDPRARNDREFVKEMVQILEGKFGLKLYIMERDLIPGCDELCVSAALIEKRCKRTILVISKAYLQSPECEVQTRSALCFSPTCHNKKILPVFIERNVKVPSVLRPMNAVDMTMRDRQMQEWSWRRIASALQMPLILTSEDKKAEKTLETISFKLKMPPCLDSLDKTVEQLQKTARKNILPIRIEKDCVIPKSIRPVTVKDYTREGLEEWFWPSIAKHLQKTLPKSKNDNVIDSSLDSLTYQLPDLPSGEFTLYK